MRREKMTMTRKRKYFSKSKLAAVCLVLLLIIVLMFLCILLLKHNGVFYEGEIEEVVKKTEKYFDIAEIEYDEILHVTSTNGGPFGEGNTVLVLRLNDKSAVKLQEHLKESEFAYTFPMPQGIAEYFNNETHNENLSAHMSAPEKGYYAFYSNRSDTLLSLDALEYGISHPIETDMLHRYFYIQFDSDEKILYIWEYN